MAARYAMLEDLVPAIKKKRAQNENRKSSPPPSAENSTDG